MEDKFEKQANEWAAKVIRAYNLGGKNVDTYKMIADIDRIIAEMFDREAILAENQ